MRISKKYFLLFVSFLVLSGGINAQTEFPAGNYWSLDAGIGMSDILVDGTSYQLLIDPKLWLSPPLMIGSKMGVNFSTDHIVTFESQVYLRWNILRLGRQSSTCIFVQGGLGLLAAYRGEDSPFDDVTMTRGSLLADVAAGITIPLSPRWHIEPSVRGGYPHIFGVSVTTGYKFPVQAKISKTEYVEIIRTVQPNEVIKRILISTIEYIMFAPDIGRFNVGIHHEAQQLNRMVLDETARVLTANPDFRVRIEGHANPFTVSASGLDDLMALSLMRANEVAALLRERGVSDDQIIIIAFGSTRTITSDLNELNMNRRVELMIIQYDPN